MNLNKLTITEARILLDRREISALDLTKSCLERIKELNNSLHACLEVCEAETLAQAEAADKRLGQGETGGLLGIPYLAKDNLLTKGLKTTAGSKILADYKAPYNATVITKLNQAGSILLGKTNLDEFAHGASTENSAFGPTKNPWDLARVPGGSSGGSAAAVASDMCLFALGSDTGGSIRQPASFCGLIGLKPTYGRISRHGLIAMTSSTDVIGPMTKTVADAALVMQVLAGGDQHDATVLKAEVPDYSAVLKNSIKGLKIGLPVEYFSKDLKPEIKKVIDEVIKDFTSLGAQMVNVTLPHTKYGVPVYYIITPSEVSSNLARFDGLRYGFQADKVKDLKDLYLQNRGQGFGPEAKRRIMLGTYALSAGYYDAYYKKAEQVRLLIKKELETVLETVDILLTPTSPHTAFKLGEQINDPLQMYLEDVFVTGPSLAGLPAISVPGGIVDGLPVGFQLIGPSLGEDKLLNFAYQYQQGKELLRPQI